MPYQSTEPFARVPFRESERRGAAGAGGGLERCLSFCRAKGRVDERRLFPRRADGGTGGRSAYWQRSAYVARCAALWVYMESHANRRARGQGREADRPERREAPP